MCERSRHWVCVEFAGPQAETSVAGQKLGCQPWYIPVPFRTSDASLRLRVLQPRSPTGILTLLSAHPTRSASTPPSLTPGSSPIFTAAPGPFSLTPESEPGPQHQLRVIGLRMTPSSWLHPLGPPWSHPAHSLISSLPQPPTVCGSTTGTALRPMQLATCPSLHRLFPGPAIPVTQSPGLSPDPAFPGKPL